MIPVVKKKKFANKILRGHRANRIPPEKNSNQNMDILERPRRALYDSGIVS